MLKYNNVAFVVSQ